MLKLILCVLFFTSNRNQTTDLTERPCHSAETWKQQTFDIDTPDGGKAKKNSFDSSVSLNKIHQQIHSFRAIDNVRFMRIFAGFAVANVLTLKQNDNGSIASKTSTLNIIIRRFSVATITMYKFISI